MVNEDVDAFLTKSDSCLYKHFEWVDIFKVPIPSFNLNGKFKSGSSFGIIATVAFFIIFINYAGLKIIDYYNQKNGLIAQSTDIGYFKPNQEGAIDLSKQGMAF